MRAMAGTDWWICEASEVLSAVDSVLPQDQRSSASEFVRRFSSLSFVRHSDTAVAEFEALLGTRLPSWLRAFRTGLFSGFEDSPSSVDALIDLGGGAAGGRGWLRIAPLAYDDEDQVEVLRDWARLLPIAHASDGREVTLAVSLDGADPTVFRYNSLTVGEMKRLNGPARNSYHAVASSLAALYARAERVRFASREIAPRGS